MSRRRQHRTDRAGTRPEDARPDRAGGTRPGPAGTRPGGPAGAAGPCPCGLGEPYGACCGRYHRGEPAPTAVALMRARYTAFARGDAGYLRRTWHPRTRPPRLDLDPGQEWTGLAVLATSGGGLFDAAGTVEFRARYRLGGRAGEVREHSAFARLDGQWLYVDGS
ncbi:hypothetical protein GCM10010123_25140 [Pilimelia anulata]|uniref:UPF0225 protein GCM10010123_25140 n=1 Tax=Pilimelia anulata TaxID=53371 RepID=A0A8J3B7R6_9ACTN|nr:YchJ family metal-binding protein [Pilimelia anulata]GGJ94267.1 hypothetical protein GCM10010123_25140 [Pilimelia anulata]